jgi:hypothetical protein
MAPLRGRSGPSAPVESRAVINKPAAEPGTARLIAVENNIKGISAVNVIAEYIPVNDRLYIHYPTDPILGAFRLRFDPTLFVQYSEVTGKNQVLPVNNRPEAFRVGAQATLRILPDLGTPESLTPLRGAVTYRWAKETYSGRDVSWFQSEITYNIDKAGYLAVGFTCKRGHDEDTGSFANVYKAGLTGKL